MSKMSFSPVEEAVLSLIGARWWTVQELQEELYPEISPEAVASAVRYLRRKNLLGEQAGGLLQTELGMMVLGEFRRSKREEYIAGSQLRAV